MQKTMAAIAVGMLLVAAPLGAQAGMFFGAHATGASLINQSDKQSGNYPVEFGSGYGMHAGLWFNSAFGVLVIHDKTIHGVKTEGVDLGQWDFLGRLSYIEAGPAKAYLTAGLSKRASTSADSDDNRGDLLFHGMAPTAGLTGQLSVTSRLAVDAGVLWTLVSYTDDLGHSASHLNRLAVGVSYYVFGGRKAVRGER
ncbi:MAG: hypothetical protein Q8K55_15525 [Gemmatimonadaceae bacterium]|nr:hypothetical protein [Gemmatimonadaceae bacterium]